MSIWFDSSSRPGSKSTGVYCITSTVGLRSTNRFIYSYLRNACTMLFDGFIVNSNKQSSWLSFSLSRKQLTSSLQVGCDSPVLHSKLGRISSILKSGQHVSTHFPVTVGQRQKGTWCETKTRKNKLNRFTEQNLLEDDHPALSSGRHSVFFINIKLGHNVVK